MVEDGIRLLKRLLVLLPGVIGAYLAVTRIYPIFDHRIPTALAIFVTYAVTAYLLIPFFIRMVRVLVKPKRVPLYCVTPDGFASDPINIGIIGTRSQLSNAMIEAGWYPADPRTWRTVMRMVKSIILQFPYPTAPFSNLYLFGRSQDAGYQLPVANNPSHRHHVRFWAASHTSDPRFTDNLGFWEKIYHSDYKHERYLWLGAASMDTGIGIIRHNAQITHMIHHDTMAERNLLVRQLKATGLVQKVRNVRVGEPHKVINRVITGHLKTDGKIRLIEL
jgi:hypothetical protein